jgi:NAD(P) transhydrogenase
MPERFDLVVIGAGPAGEKAAVQAAYFGKSVCVIDRGPAGGVWVNTGTIPSKTLRESALSLADARRRGSGAGLHVREVMALERRLVARWREKVEHGLRSHGVTRMTGSARFVDDTTLQVTAHDGSLTEVGATNILIATGSRPRQVPFAKVDGRSIHDSDTVLGIAEIPKQLVVLGGGVVACEYASLFQALGVQVTLYNSQDRLLGWLDPEASELLEKIFAEAGMVVRHEVRATSVVASEKGVEVHTDDGAVGIGDACLLALGRVPNTGALDLQAAGLKTSDWGTLDTDEYMRTAVPHIYAAGDVVGFPSLASVSMEQGRVASAHMFDIERGPMPELFPNGVFTIPEVSCVGLDEAAAIEQGIDAVSGSAGYHHSVRSAMLGEEAGMVKLVAERATGRLLGATLVGAQATELIHYAAAVINYRGTVMDLTRFVFNLPSLSVLYKQAAYDVLHRMRTGDHNEMVD